MTLLLAAVLSGASLFAQEISTISVPIEASLAPILPEIEKQVPRMFADRVNEAGFDVRYDVVRDPITLKMIGAGLHTTTVARYWMQACPPRLRCVSCGSDEPRRQAQILLHSHFTWDAQWRIRSTTRAQPARFPNRCAITRLNIDITDRFIAPVVDQQLRDAAKSIDQNIPRLTNIRPTAQQIWTSLQAPVEIAPKTWLVFEPLDVALSPLRGEGLRVFTTLSIRARTRVVVGVQRAATKTPLPPLKTADLPGGLHIPFDVHVPYEEAAQLATAQFGNRTYGKLRIGAMKFSPAANGRIRVDALIDYAGGRLRRYSGPIVMEGTPQYANGTVVIPDLEYKVESRNLLFRAVEGLAHDEIRAQMRASAKWPVTAELEQVRNEITRAMNRPLAPGVVMSGKIDAVTPQSVVALPAELIVRAQATGAAGVRVTRN